MPSYTRCATEASERDHTLKGSHRLHLRLVKNIVKMEHNKIRRTLSGSPMQKNASTAFSKLLISMTERNFCRVISDTARSFLLHPLPKLFMCSWALFCKTTKVLFACQASFYFKAFLFSTQLCSCRMGPVARETLRSSTSAESFT